MVKMNSRNINQHTQQGSTLIILVLVLLLAGTAALFSVLDGSGVKIERTKANALMLANAKTTLIGYAVGATGAGQRLGDLMMPDAFSTNETPANYDGSADSACLDFTQINGSPLINSSINMRCLGRLPWKDLGLSISGISENDPNGTMPWYAVSANLLDPTCLKVLNSNTLNLVNNPPPAALDCTGVTLPYPWLTVRNSNGNILSDRVAAIIFAPNAVRGTQSRLNLPNLGMVNQYLDTLVVPVGCAAPCVPGIYSNADMDNDYILSSEGNPSAMTSNFNDQLVYITIDELMAAVERRVAGEVRKQLIAYKTMNGDFPDAADLGYQGQSCEQDFNSGFLPLPIFSCTGSKCDGAFPATIKFTSDQNYASSSGACTRVAKTCSCTGLGGCSKTTGQKRSFSCSSTGTCVSNVTGTFNYTPSSPIDGSSMSVTSGLCTVTGTTATCTGAGNVIVSGSTNSCTLPTLAINNFPAWFLENGWKHFIYYAKGNLTVGARSASSLLITSGSMLTSQSQPSSLITNYLDSPENTDENAIYDPIGAVRTSTYNDQMFIVSP